LPEIEEYLEFLLSAKLNRGPPSLSALYMVLNIKRVVGVSS
jgi:hypothetical protein